jgi:hypothetical protein
MKKRLLLAVLFLSLLPAIPSGAKLTINEFMAVNVLGYANADGDYEDWIEIHNSSGASVNLMGYYLTDDLAGGDAWQIPAGSPSKTTVPANGYLILYADGNPDRGANHLGFKLNAISETIALLGQDGMTVLDSVSYRDQFRDVSYGRFPDGGSQWEFFTEFTPGEANRRGFIGFVDRPSILPDAGLYPGPVTVSVQPASAGDVIRYTLDGSDPDESSTVYASPVSVNGTAVFKARGYRTGALPSTMAMKAFLIGTDHTLPVLALIADPDNLYDSETGIYMHDGDGRGWERPAALDYFTGGTFGFQIQAGIRVQGNTGPATFDKKSLRVYFRDGYGKPRLGYPLFPRDSVTSFNNLVLRSGYDDSMDPKNSSGTLLRDPLVTELWRRTGELTSQSRFSVLYLNTDFQGIYDVKQSIDEDFVRDHLGYRDLDLMRTRWDSTELVYGSRDEWQSLVRFFQDNTFTDDAKLAEAETRFDLNSFTTLHALAHATAYKSWAYGTFMFREKADGARWFWTIWDADRSLTEMDFNALTNTYNTTMVFLNNLITKKLLQNQTYKNRYINRVADLLNTTFSSESVKSIIDSLVANIAADIPDDVSRWNNTVPEWEENVEALRDFTENRPSTVRQQLLDYFLLTGLADLTIGTERGAGTVKVNTVFISKFPWTGKYFKDVPVTLTATAGPGYRFEGWSDPDLPSSPTVTLPMTGNTSVNAVFAPVGEVNAELIAPARIRPGQRMPVVVRIRDAQWNINPLEQTPMVLKFGGARADSTIEIKRGAGTGVVRVQSAADFTLTAGNAAVPQAQKTVRVPSSFPSTDYSGTLPAGDVVWDAASDRVVSGTLTVPLGCRLVIKAGTWVLFKRYAGMDVRGRILVEGTESEPVVFAPETWSDPWGGLEFQATSASFRYCFFVNGGGDGSKGNPSLNPSSPSYGWHTGRQHILFANGNSDLVLDQCFILNSIGKALGSHFSKVTMTNCVTSFVWHGGELHWSRFIYRNSHMMNLPNDDHIWTEDIDTDGFHIDYVHPDYPEYSVIDCCYFVTGKDDAVDQHSARLRITNCWFEDFIHEGLAASGGDTVRVFNTVSRNNDTGFESAWTEGGVARGPFVLIDHCVATGNRIAGLRVGDDYPRGSFEYRSFMKATNTVVYGNKDNVMNYINSTAAPLPGALEVSYSMTNDADYDNSPRCITGVPQIDSLFYLLPGSPGTGMGTRGTNMGRTDSTALTEGPVLVNEIMYNAPNDGDTGDWIELYNPQSVTQDISRWVLKDENNTHAFTIPSGTTVPAAGFRVLCVDAAAFGLIHPDVPDVVGGVPFGFGAKDQVRLFSSSGLLVDSVAYDNNGRWPAEPDGRGYSLELISPSRDRSVPESWAKSVRTGGTPGRANRTTGVEERDDDGRPDRFALEQNYPNPFNPVTRIAYALPHSGRVQLSVYDLRGRKVLTLADNLRQSAGLYSFDVDARSLTSGIYVVRIQIAYDNGGGDMQNRKMVLIK